MMIVTRSKNRLLAALPEHEYEHLENHLYDVRMTLGRVVQQAHHPIRKLVFPVDCAISLLYLSTEGDATEVAVVGREGVVGVAGFLGGISSPTHAVVQASGHAYVLDIGIASAEFNAVSAFRARLLLFTQALMTQIAQTAACNRHHSIEQQLCRRLLLTCDRVDSNTLYMTHELIASMLGVRRVGISEAAAKLQNKGFIRCQRGQITLVDRAGLESTACECYGVIASEYRKLLSE